MKKIMNFHDPHMVCEKGRGRSRISGKRAHMHKGEGVCFTKFYLIFHKYPMKLK